MAFDPRTLGCKCDACPLQACTPVPPQAVTKPVLTILGEAPGASEVEEGKPFIGASGRLVEKATKENGLARANLHITNTLLCRPPKQFSPGEWKAALACCAPRLEQELGFDRDRPILALGGKALQALTGRAKITPWMGAELKSPFGRVLPALHPAACLRKPAYISVFRIYFQRAVLMARGQLPDWRWPELVVEPGRRMVEALEELSRAGKPIGVDVETGGLDPLSSPLLCVGVANEDLAVSVPWDWRGAEAEVDALRQLLASDLTKVLHNAQHDLLTCQAHGIQVSGDIFDTMLAHVIAAPQLAHDLGFVASLEFHAPRWKTEFHNESDLKGSEAFARRDAFELRTYNAKDALMTVRLMPRLEKRVLTEVFNGPALLLEQHRLAKVAMKMRLDGMQIDRSKFGEHRARLTEIMEKAEASFHQTVGQDYALGKSGQHGDLKRLFFETFGIRPVSFTEEGEPQLDAKMLTNIISGVNKQASAAARAALDYRKAAKLRSTYVDGLPLDGNDVVHPVWKPHGTVTGRWSSAEPNAQNFPVPMRDLVIARSSNAAK